MTQTASPALHFSGNVFLNISGTGLIGPIDVSSLQIKPDADKRTLSSKMNGQYGNARETYYLGKPAQITIKTTDIPPTLLAPAFMGAEVAINQASGSLTDEAVTLPAYPGWVKLSKGNLSSTGFSVKKTSTALPEEDYEVNYALGLLRASESGSLKAGGAVTVTATYNAISGTRIKGNVKPFVTAALLMDGQNLVDGRAMHLEIPSCTLSPSSELDFLSENAIEVTLAGELQIKQGETAAFYVDFPEPVAAP